MIYKLNGVLHIGPRVMLGPVKFYKITEPWLYIRRGWAVSVYTPFFWIRVNRRTPEFIHRVMDMRSTSQPQHHEG